MRTLQARLLTFHEHLHRWPQERLAATSDDTAKAGLYYLKTNDRVKCWYCNGGLQNWDRFDNPWFEHAKWFPQCEFFLQQKGPDFVENITCRFTNLNRPRLSNPVSLSATNLSSISPGPLIVDPKQEQAKQKSKAVAEMERSPFTSEAKLMGFTENAILHAFHQKLNKDSWTFTTFAALVDSLLDLQLDTEENFVTDTTTNVPNSDPSISNHTEVKRACDSTSPSLAEINNQYLCKKCFQNKASTVFLPCGHLATCKKCSMKDSKCPICRITVQERIHAYIA